MSFLLSYTAAIGLIFGCARWSSHPFPHHSLSSQKWLKKAPSSMNFVNLTTADQ